MKSIRFMTIFAIVAFVSSPMEASLSKVTRAAEDASAEITKLVDGFTTSFNNHDVQAVSMWFTDDADFVNVQQAISHSRKGIEEHFLPLFSGALKNAHRSYTLKNIRLISPEVASVTMDYVVTNGEQPPRRGLYDWVVVRQNGKWLISVLHESELAAAAPRAQTATSSADAVVQAAECELARTTGGKAQLYEVRIYRIKPGMMDGFVNFMSEKLVPYEESTGMHILGHFVAAKENTYVWIRVYPDMGTQQRMIDQMHSTAEWKNSIAPRVGQYIDKIEVLFMTPTAYSRTQ